MSAITLIYKSLASSIVDLFSGSQLEPTPNISQCISHLVQATRSIYHVTARSTRQRLKNEHTFQRFYRGLSVNPDTHAALRNKGGGGLIV